MNDLVDIISNWLSEQMPEWIVERPHVGDPGACPPDKIPWCPPGSIGVISYKDLSYQHVWIYDDKVEFIYNYGSSSDIKSMDKSPMDRGMTLHAHIENFLPLLSNRLYMAGLGYKKAWEAREYNKHRTDN